MHALQQFFRTVSVMEYLRETEQSSQSRLVKPSEHGRATHNRLTRDFIMSAGYHFAKRTVAHRSSKATDRHWKAV